VRTARSPCVGRTARGRGRPSVTAAAAPVGRPCPAPTLLRPWARRWPRSRATTAAAPWACRRRSRRSTGCPSSPTLCTWPRASRSCWAAWSRRARVRVGRRPRPPPLVAGALRHAERACVPGPVQPACRGPTFCFATPAMILLGSPAAGPAPGACRPSADRARPRSAGRRRRLGRRGRRERAGQPRQLGRQPGPRRAAALRRLDRRRRRRPRV